MYSSGMRIYHILGYDLAWHLNEDCMIKQGSLLYLV